ncbi:helix-turn-helix domain-containing protein [Streptomyces sp. NPDC018031]|uniref:helix-turn-helix domain-containing protein n=1 Tax=Streptomyces sp. NPDC018031 TaxID=3365033 RepID=UPI00378FF1FC
MASENLPVTAAPPAQALVVGRFSRGHGYAVRRPAGAPSWLLLWTDGGAGRVRQGGADLTVGPGDLAVLGPGSAQDYRSAPGPDRWCFWWVHFQPRPAWEAWLRPYLRGRGCYLVPGVAPGLRPWLDGALRRLHADARWSGEGPPPAAVAAGRRTAPAVAAALPGGHELALGGVERVLLLATSGTAAVGGGDARVRRAEALIAADPAAPHTVASLAAAVALSPSRFAHLFTARTGVSPMRALREARLRQAARLLETTALDVGQVAAASGFASPFHFSRVFRARFGASPRRYRGG